MADYFDNTDFLNSINKENPSGENSHGNGWVYFTIAAIVLTAIVIAVNYEIRLRQADSMNNQLQQRINQIKYLW